MPEFDNFPCPEKQCCNGDLLRDPDPRCTTCGGSGTVVRPTGGGRA